MATKTKNEKREAQNPLILRCHRLMEAFAKSNDERDFYMDRMEGFLIYIDLDKGTEELANLEKELKSNPERYCPIPKLTLYETKKIMEGFVNEKVYDIDTKEKLLDIIQSKEARENFIEFIYDHHSELEKWQQYYQERSRIRIIEWLRQNHFHFVFEEDLELTRGIIEKLKKNLFEKNIGKENESARKTLISKAKTYYSNEALNPRPKRGRPPKQIQKLEIEPQLTADFYVSVPQAMRPFLFIPEISSMIEVTFSTRFESGRDLIANRKQALSGLTLPDNINNITQKLEAMRQLSSSSQWLDKKSPIPLPTPSVFELKEQDKAIFKRLEEKGSNPGSNTKTAMLAPPPTKRRPVSPQTSKKMVLKPSTKKSPIKNSPPQKVKQKLPPLKKIAATKLSKANSSSKLVKKKFSAQPLKKIASKNSLKKITPSNGNPKKAANNSKPPAKKAQLRKISPPKKVSVKIATKPKLFQVKNNRKR